MVDRNPDREVDNRTRQAPGTNERGKYETSSAEIDQVGSHFHRFRRTKHGRGERGQRAQDVYKRQLVNRSEEPERAEVVLRRGSFAGTARVRCVTGTGRPSAVDGVEEADLDDATVSTRDAQVVVELPARSFTLVEAGLQGA